MSKVRVLSEREYRSKAYKAFSSIFRNDDPFDEPFVSSVSHRAILWPVMYELEPTELQAIVIAARAIGDTGFYLSITERPVESEQGKYPYHWHWFIPLEDAHNYHSLDGCPFVLENAIYSPTGRWGIMISHEQHGVVGGNKLFVDTLFANLPVSADDQVRKFLGAWKDNHDRLHSQIDWLPRLMSHVYGPEKAQQLLAEAGL